jgi:hypothetical protein
MEPKAYEVEYQELKPMIEKGGKVDVYDSIRRIVFGVMKK